MHFGPNSLAILGSADDIKKLEGLLFKDVRFTGSDDPQEAIWPLSKENMLLPIG